MIHKFTASRNQKVMLNFINELFSIVESQDLCVVKLEVKRLADYKALLKIGKKFDAGKEGSFWGLRLEDIKHDSHATTDFIAYAEEGYHEVGVGNLITVSKKEEAEVKKIEAKINTIRAELWKEKRKQADLCAKLTNKYRGKEYRCRGIVS
jgi:hypothetical protein